MVAHHPGIYTHMHHLRQAPFRILIKQITAGKPVSVAGDDYIFSTVNLEVSLRYINKVLNICTMNIREVQNYSFHHIRILWQDGRDLGIMLSGYIEFRSFQHAFYLPIVGNLWQTICIDRTGCSTISAR